MPVIVTFSWRPQEEACPSGRAGLKPRPDGPAAPVQPPHFAAFQTDPERDGSSQNHRKSVMGRTLKMIQRDMLISPVRRPGDRVDCPAASRRPAPKLSHCVIQNHREKGHSSIRRMAHRSWSAHTTAALTVRVSHIIETALHLCLRTSACTGHRISEVILGSGGSQMLWGIWWEVWIIWQEEIDMHFSWGGAL